MFLRPNRPTSPLGIRRWSAVVVVLALAPAGPAAASSFSATTPVAGFGTTPALAQIAGVSAAVAEPGAAFAASQRLATADNATLPQPTAGAISPGAALVASSGPHGAQIARGQATRATQAARTRAAGNPTVTTNSGAVRGVDVPSGYAFRGLPYASPPVGALRWRAPRRPASWRGTRDASHFAPSCPQQPNPLQPPGPQSENCLFLNISTPTLRHNARRPVLVWIHGGGLTQDGALNYDATKLAADGVVVVTINYRLGALGFLAHPALASRRDGPSGNYGLMDQQAALRWVKHDIARFGGDPHNVTIAGQSAGGLSVLAHLVSPRSRGLFDRAIVQSGAFALNQVRLSQAEAFGRTFANQVGCPDQSASCLRHVPVATLVKAFPSAAIPGVVDGDILKQPIGAALAAGRFAHVPILNGVNHNEEWIFVAGQQLAVSGGMFVPAPTPDPSTYESVIASVLGVSAARASAVAAEYPLSAYPAPVVALSTLVSDAEFACPALQVDRWTARRAPTFAYEFDDDTAPQLFAGPKLPPIATHSSEIQYLFGQPNAPFATSLNPAQEHLATTMRAAWAHFAAAGDPASTAAPWRAFNTRSSVLSLVTPQPHEDPTFATTHDCSFWAAG